MNHLDETIYSAASIMGEDGKPYDLFLRRDCDEAYRWYLHVPATDSTTESEEDTEVGGPTIEAAKASARASWAAESWGFGIQPAY